MNQDASRSRLEEMEQLDELLSLQSVFELDDFDAANLWRLRKSLGDTTVSQKEIELEVTSAFVEGHLAQQEAIELPEDFREKLTSAIPSQAVPPKEEYQEFFPSNPEAESYADSSRTRTPSKIETWAVADSREENELVTRSSLNQQEPYVGRGFVGRGFVGQWLGWVAAAACLVIAAGVSLNQSNGVSTEELDQMKSAMKELQVVKSEFKRTQEELQTTNKEFTALENENKKNLLELLVLRPKAEELEKANQLVEKNRMELIALRATAKELQSFKKPDGDVAQEYAKKLYAEMSKDVGSENVVRVGWKDGNGKELPGDVVWNKDKHFGVMRLATLPGDINPEENYQLWIFDPDRLKRGDLVDRVGGAVFRLERKETFILIQSPLKLLDVSQLAITIEPNGGVVQSKLEKISAISKVGN